MTVLWIEPGLFADVCPSARRRADNITGRTYLERGSPVVVLVRWSGKGPCNVADPASGRDTGCAALPGSAPDIVR
jgi:hypothetical protein